MGDFLSIGGAVKFSTHLGYMTGMFFLYELLSAVCCVIRKITNSAGLDGEIPIFIINLPFLISSGDMVVGPISIK